MVIRMDFIIPDCGSNLQGLPEHLNEHPRVSEQNLLPLNIWFGALEKLHDDQATPLWKEEGGGFPPTRLGGGGRLPRPFGGGGGARDHVYIHAKILTRARRSASENLSSQLQVGRSQGILGLTACP